MGKTVAKEVTTRNEVRAAIAAGGWDVIYGDLLNEADVLTFAISIPTGTVGGWVSQQIQAQLVKFSQSLADVSDDVVEQATDYLKGLMKGHGSGEADIHGLGVKGGFATYKRHMVYHLWGKKVGSHVLPNNHQPYIALRVSKPLPLKGQLAPTSEATRGFVLQTGTTLHETDGTFDFALGDWNQDGRPDLFAIKKSNTGSKSTEVHVLSGALNFQTYILQTGTTLHETDSTFDFAVGDWNQDGRPDLFAIKKSNTGSKSTEVHILSGASNYQSFILQTGTGLHETDSTFDFALGDWNQDGRLDLFVIKKSNTGSKSTEVHILSGASNFQKFILQTGTALHETDDTFDFAVGDWNQDGRPDLFAIKKSNTGSKSTEVHVLSGASNFQTFILQTGTALHETDDTFDFAVGDWNQDRRPDLFAIKKSKTGSKSTEVHVISP